MAAGYVTKTVGDGNGGAFTARFWSSDGTAGGLLYPAPVLADGAGAEVLGEVTASPTANTVLDRLKAINASLAASLQLIPAGRTYKTVAASQTAQTLGTGATGDVLDGLLIVPATTSPGNVIILDNATSITVFAGGASSVSNLVCFWVALNSIASVSGAWKVTTGANVSVIAVGKFTP